MALKYPFTCKLTQNLDNQGNLTNVSGFTVEHTWLLY